MCYRVLQCVAVERHACCQHYCSFWYLQASLQCPQGSCCMLQCVTVCCSVLQGPFQCHQGSFRCGCKLFIHVETLSAVHPSTTWILQWVRQSPTNWACTCIVTAAVRLSPDLVFFFFSCVDVTSCMNLFQAQALVATARLGTAKRERLTRESSTRCKVQWTRALKSYYTVITRGFCWFDNIFPDTDSVMLQSACAFQT